MEHSPVSIPVDSLNSVKLTLPLPNGLLKTADGLYLVKDTRTVHVCAVVYLEANTVAFVIEGPRANRRLTWRFYSIRGNLQYALRLANRINSVDDGVAGKIAAD